MVRKKLTAITYLLIAIKRNKTVVSAVKMRYKAAQRAHYRMTQQNVAASTTSLAHSQQSPAHRNMANAIRFLAAEAVQKANSGHPGMPMGMADVATVLFRDFLKFNPKDPSWPDRDRFVLSAGHGSMLLYALLYLTGYEDMTLEEIRNFRQWGAKTAGHPEFGHASGIETTTGPLGQGLANAVGMALAERLMAARFAEITDHYTYVIAGDGCLMEGISHEAISLAGHLKLGKLIVLWDDNQISIDGPTSLSVSDDQMKRFEASGWDCQAVDGHDPKAIKAAISKAQRSDTPSMIACRTKIGYGAPTKVGTAGCHGSPLGDTEIAGAREALGWPHAAFSVPKDILAEWRGVAQRNEAAYAGWQKAHKAHANKAEFDRQQAGTLPKAVAAALDALKKSVSEKNPSDATRKCSGNVLDVIAPLMPELIGGSADLTGSNNTKAKGQQPVQPTAHSPQPYTGNYIYYGVREHAMCAAMNGLALHGGLIPYGGTFFVFTDYCRPAIRLAALMQQRVIFVMTHDSIGLGEDGPTHQPVEHLASLRAMPNVHVLRPADGVETAECWQLALEAEKTPSILVLSRQNLPTVRGEHTKENLCARGGYVLSRPTAHSPQPTAQVTLIASGSEISIALEAEKMLAEQGISASVVSMPCTSLFDAQPEAYQQEVLGGDKVLKVAIEAASDYGWERYIGRDGIFIGMQGFGASAPAEELYKQFGITAENVVERVNKRISR